MAYGTMITTLGADWANYKKDLDRAYRELEAFHEKTQRLATTVLRAAASGGSGGTGRSGGSFGRAGSPFASVTREGMIQVEGELSQGEKAVRRYYANWDQAEKENQRKIVVSNKAKVEATNKILSEGAKLRKFYADWNAAEKENQVRGGEADRKKAQELKEFLSLEKDYRKFYADWDAAAKENEKRVLGAEKAKEEAVKASLSQQMGELRARNTQRQSFAAEERERLKAEQKLIAQTAADFEKEFQRPGRQALPQAARQALAQGKAADDLAAAEAKLKSIGEIHLPRINQAMTQFRQAVRVTAGYAAAVGTTSLVGGFALLAKEALDVNVEYQKNRQTIAQILGMTTEWVDQQGKAVDQSRQLNLNYAQADRLLPAIRLQAAKLNLTFQESAKVFSEGFGIALQRGISPEKAVPLIGQISELAKALGSDPLREVRALIGGLRPAQSKILLNVGLDPKSLKDAIASGKLLDYLNGVLQRGLPYIQRYEKQWEVLSTTLVSSAHEVVRIATERVFERITGQVETLDKRFSEANIQRWGKQFGDALTNAYDSVDRFVHSDTFKGFTAFFKYLVEHAQTLIEVFAAWKGAQLVGAGIGIAKEAGAIGSIYRQGGGVAALGAASQALKGEEIGGVAASAAAGSGAIATAALVAAIYDLIKSLELIKAVIDIRGANRSTEQTERETARMRMSPQVREHTAAEAGVIRAQDRLAQTRSGFVIVPSDIAAAEKALTAARDRLHAADKADAAERDKLSGTSARKEVEVLHQRVLQHQQAADTRKKIAAQEALYLARLTAKTTEDDIQKIHAKLDADILAAKKVVTNETDKGKAAVFLDKATKLLRDKAHQDVLDKLEDQRLETKRQVAEELGDKKSLAQAEAAINIKKVKDDVTGGVEGKAQAAQRIAAIQQGLARQLKEIDQDVTDKARDNAKQYRDEIRREAEEQKSLKKEQRDLEVRTERELHNLIKERTQAIKDLYRTQAEESLKARQSEIDTGRQALRDLARKDLARSGAFDNIGSTLQPLRDKAEEDARERFRMDLAGAQGGRGSSVSLSPAQEAAEAQTAKAAGDEAVKNASGVIQENMITRAIQTNRFGLGGVAGNIDNKQSLLDTASAQQKTAEAASDLGKANEEAKKKLDDLNLQQKELMDSFREASKTIKEKFVKDLTDFHEAFTKFAPDFLKVLREAATNHVALSAPVRAALQAGTTVPSQAQVSRALGGAPIIINLTGGSDQALDEALRRILKGQNLRSTVP